MKSRVIRWTIVGCVAFWVALLGACGGPSTANLYQGPALGEPEYRLGVADKVSVEVKDNASFSATKAVVRPDGNLTLPIIDDIKVVGLTPAQVKAEIVRRLEAYIKQPIVTVSLVELNSYDFFVSGNVRAPNRYTSKALVTVLQALAMAGDVTNFATPERIVVIRRFADGQRRIPFDYPAVVDGTRLEQNIYLESGDVVFVP